MISYASSCYPIAVQSVRNAIGCDGRGETKNAYCQYLSCMLFVIQALKDEAWERQDLKELCHGDTFKLFKLTEQCLDRAHDILKSLHGDLFDGKTETIDYLNQKTQPPHPALRRHSHSPQPTSSLPSERKITRSMTNYNNTPTNDGNKYKTLMELMPTPPGYTTATVTASTSPQNFHAKNHEIFQAYQRRKTLRGKQRYGAINLPGSDLTITTTKYRLSRLINLDLFRKEAEKMAIQKAREKAAYTRFLERQKEMKIEAERRWNRRQNHSSRDKEYRQSLLVAILAFEEDAGWPKTFRKTLTPNCEPVVITNAIQAMLASRDHPLSKVLNDLKHSIYQRIRTLLETSQAANRNASTTENEYLAPVDSLDRRNIVNQPTGVLFTTAGVLSTTIGDLSTTPGDVQVSDVFSEQAGNVNDKVRLVETSRNSTSLEQAFDEMGCSMFDSDPEEEEEEDNSLDVNSNEKSQEDALHECTDVEGDATDYKVLDAGYDTLQRNREFFKKLSDTHISNEGATDDPDHPGTAGLHKENSGGYSSLIPDARTSNNYEFCDLKTTKLSVTSDCSDGVNSTVTTTSDVDIYKSLDEVDNDEYETLANKNTPVVKRESIYEEIDYEETREEESVEAKPMLRAQTKKIYREISEDKLAKIGDDYLRELDNIVQDLLFGIDRLQSALLLTYEGIDTPEGRDQCYVTLEGIIFKSLWSWIIQMFRWLNAHKEDALRKIMQKNSRSDPKEMKVPQKFTLQDESQDSSDQRPYQIAIDELKHLAQYETPLEKLECVVRMSKAICHCVESYWQEKGESNPPRVGGDDLLPIVTYVVVKSRSPQLVSECHAVEEFIHEGYLLGEEGYCLTTLHTALSYLVSLGKDL